MIEFLHGLLHNPISKGFLSGVVAASLVDFTAFRTWKSWHDAEEYDWGIASFRWVQGGIVGALTATGLGYL